MTTQIEPGMKFVMIAEVVRMETDEDMGFIGGDPADPYSHNKWGNKYLCRIPGRDFVICCDQPEAFLRLVKAAKYFEQEWDQSLK